MSEVTNSVRFVLDGRIVEAQGKRRTTTVLDFLREQLHRTGTKEGCAEGDCGACVVLVGDLDETGNTIRYLPINSCIHLLPTLDGKSVKTVESLRRADGTLHAVQEQMVACHGSQCGFCTPGIVMSLAHHLHEQPSPTRQSVCDALAGNLCRCTGYKPIVDAALQAASAPPAQRAIDDAADVPLLREIRRSKQPTYSLHGDLVVQPVVRTRKGSEFVSPANLDELTTYLREHPDATLLAGSTEIGLKVNKQHWRPSNIVYLGHIEELQRVDETPTAWRVGAQVSLERVMQLVRTAYPAFAEVLRRFGSPPIRSTATLAGNIANGSPIGDSMPCLMALDAVVHLRQGDARRRVALAQFYTGQKQTVLKAGEFIEAVEFPKPVAGRQFHAHKISKRFDQDISATCMALALSVQGERLKNVRVACNGLAPSPCRASKIEAIFEGMALADVQSGLASGSIAAAVDTAIGASFTARDGLRATWAYRSLVARNLVLRFVAAAHPSLAEAVAEGDAP